MRKPPPPASLSRSSFVPPVLGYRLPSPPIVREAMSELPRVGVNLNQLTRLGHTTGDMPAFAELRAIRGVLEAAVRSALDL